MTCGRLAEVRLPRPDVDPDGLLEYSVVFTDRSLNHMSQRFVGVMQDIVDVLRTTYRAETVAVVPGGGTYAMEAVARQLATGRPCLVVRNGLFSYRWSQILEAGVDRRVRRRCAAPGPASDEPQAPWVPAPVAEVVEAIEQERPEVVFAAHVETAAGHRAARRYVRAVAAATHEVGGLFVLDCIASGALWVDMADLGVDVLLSAPQKGWSGSPGAGYVMLGEDGARPRSMATTSTSFAVDLQKWLTITEAYTRGQDAVPRDDADRHARRTTPRCMRRDARSRAGRAARRAGRSSARGCARCSPGAGFASVAARGLRRAERRRRPTPTTRQIRSGAEAQGARAAGRGRRAADVRRGRGLLDLPRGALRARQARPTSTAPSSGSRRDLPS